MHDRVICHGVRVVRGSAILAVRITGPRSGDTSGTSIKEQKENMSNEVVQRVAVSNNSVVIAI